MHLVYYTSNIDWTNFFSKFEGKYVFYVTGLQVEELPKITDFKEEVRIRHMLYLFLFAPLCTSSLPFFLTRILSADTYQTLYNFVI